MFVHTKYVNLYASCEVQGKAATTEEALDFQVKMMHAVGTR